MTREPTSSDSADSSNSTARRYAGWIDAHRWWVLAACVVVSIGAATLALGLPVRSGMDHLLPPSARSVQDLAALKGRAQSFGTAYVVVVSDDAALRERAANLVFEECQKIPDSLLAEVKRDESAAIQFGWDHRFLFVDLQDLQDARDALADKIRDAKLAANPFYIDLEDEPAEADDGRLDKLRAKLDDAEAKAAAPPPYVSEDGRVQVISMRASSMSGSNQAERLVVALRDVVASVSEQVGPGVQFGLTGTVPTTVYEHESILRGMKLAGLITLLLVAIGLVLFYRAVLPVLASLASLVAGVLVTFAIAKLTIGHLNVMTAFLSAIVIGNGINTGLMLLARVFEEARAGRVGTVGLGSAIAGSAPGTLAAALTAGVAYASLAVTDFRGFRHFGIIAGIGMVACWVLAFTALPALLCVLERRGWLRVRGEASWGAVVVRLVPRRLGMVVAIAAVVVAVGAGITVDYLTGSPFLVNWEHLRSDSGALRVARDWDARMRPAFGRTRSKAAAGRFAIALDTPAGALALAERLRAVDEGVPERQRLFASVNTVEDMLPADQARKLELLADIRRMIEDDVVDEFDEDDRAMIARVTPPADLRLLTIDDIPANLAWPFIEKDGTRGRLVIASRALRFKTWNVDHRVAFARAVRALDLPDDAVIGGQSFVTADIITSMRRDGPIAIGVAFVGSALAIFLIVGFGRHAVVTFVCVVGGMTLMMALCALAGVRLHFMDLVAVPITIGIGADYAVNLVARARQEGDRKPRRVLRTTGGAVLLCSFTTTVGYGSLLLSENGGIREFGLAAILGEITCIGLALWLAPSLVAYWRGQRVSDA